MAHCEEVLLPIIVDTVVINGSKTGTNVQYRHTIKSGCSQQEYLASDKLSYKHNITKLDIPDNMAWPEHPQVLSDYPPSRETRMAGSIVYIVSADDHILFVKNNRKWGFPKGARYYLPYKDLVDSSVKIFQETGSVHRHPILTLDTMDNTQQESPLDNARREVLEETGIDVPVEHYTYLPGNVSGYDRFLLKFPYRAEEYYERFLSRNGTDPENDEIRWISRDDFIHMYVNGKFYLNKITADTIKLLSEEGLF